MQVVSVDIYHASLRPKSMKLNALFRSSFCAVTFCQVGQLTMCSDP